MHGYAQLLRRHIDTEETVLFPQAEDALPPEEQRRLAEAYDRHERETVGEGRHEEFHGMIDRLRMEYLESRSSAVAGVGGDPATARARVAASIGSSKNPT